MALDQQENAMQKVKNSRDVGLQLKKLETETQKKCEE
jgi:hypothetical protein